MSVKKLLTAHETEWLLQTVKLRFKNHAQRHPGLTWMEVEAKLKADPDKLWTLNEMEKTGGEPDVVCLEIDSRTYSFVDCSAESPSGRRSVCYDQEGWLSRKDNRPANNAVEMAAEMGIKILAESEYRKLHEFGNFDSKTSSWLNTPVEQRNLGGAIFGDYRFGRVFVYHNGAQSYYAGRAFRGSFKL